MDKVAKSIIPQKKENLWKNFESEWFVAVGSAPLQRKVAPEWRADQITENGEDEGD